MMAEIFLKIIKKADKLNSYPYFYIEIPLLLIIALTIYCIPIAITMNPTILEIAIIPDAPSILAR
jgi:hypothetical protein